MVRAHRGARQTSGVVRPASAIGRRVLPLSLAVAAPGDGTASRETPVAPIRRTQMDECARQNGSWRAGPRAPSSRGVAWLAAAPSAGAQTYDDVASGHWARGAIDWITDVGPYGRKVLDDYGSSFKPEKKITRAQLARALVIASGHQDDPVTPVALPDVVPELDPVLLGHPDRHLAEAHVGDRRRLPARRHGPGCEGRGGHRTHGQAAAPR